MASQARNFVSPEEYLEWELKTEHRNEYLNGQIFAMAGVSIPHGQISSNISGNLFIQLKGGRCRVHASDTRVRTGGANMYTYPDVVVFCGEARVQKYKGTDSLLNPTVIFEVLSPSTEKYDRRKKFQMYREILSLQEYVLVSQDKVLVERYVRKADGEWQQFSLDSLEATLELPSISATLKLADIYDQALPKS
jgi:Uma2 family endonuclease